MKIFKIISAIILNLLVAIVLGTVLLYVVFLLPNDRVEKHMAQSAITIQEEGMYPCLSQGFSSTLDNFTDSLMLLNASDANDESALNRAMAVYHGNIGEENNPLAMLIYHYVEGVAFDREYDYPRYWHGYLVFLKPLLEFFDFSMIRVINGIVQVLLFLSTAWLMFERKKEFYIIPWMIGYLLLMPIVLAKSLQYSSCHYVFMVGTLALLLVSEKKLREYGVFIFLNIGIATAFFDLLTYPIATYGVPMLVFLMLTDGDSFKNKIINIIKNGIFWGAGYGGMWISKWILATRILGRDIVADGISQFTERVSDNVSGYQLSKGMVVLANYLKFFDSPAIYIAAACMVYLIYMIIKSRNYHLKEALKRIAPYWLVGLTPVIWYIFAANHSAIHAWFTNKACLVSVLAVFFGLISLTQEETEKKE